MAHNRLESAREGAILHASTLRDATFARRGLGRPRRSERLAKTSSEIARADPTESRVGFQAGPAANNPGPRAVLRRHAPSATRQRTLEANGIDCGAGRASGAERLTPAQGAARARARGRRAWRGVSGRRPAGSSATVADAFQKTHPASRGGQARRPSLGRGAWERAPEDSLSVWRVSQPSRGVRCGRGRTQAMGLAARPAPR